MTTDLRRKNLAALSRTRHDRCVACGGANPHGLHLTFRCRDEGAVEAGFDCQPRYAGYPNQLHGGVIATLLDSAMTNCMFAHGEAAVTAELRVRFQAPVATGRPAVVRAWPEKRAHRMSQLRAEISQDGRVKVSAWGKFMHRGHTPG